MLRWKVLGLLTLAATVGCSATPTTKPKDKDTNVVKNGKDDDHGEGPHKGVVFHFGKYHAEFKPDHAKKEATIWILGEDEKTPAAIVIEKPELSVKADKDKKFAAFVVELKPMPEAGEKDGKASRYVATHDSFGVEAEFAGTLRGKLDGKPTEEAFEEKAAK